MFLILVIAATVIGFYIFAFARRSSLRAQNPERVYAATVKGRRGELYVRIGGGDGDWQPSDSNHSGYREYARGDGWKVWVKLPGNPPPLRVSPKQPLPIPTYRPAEGITVADNLLQ